MYAHANSASWKAELQTSERPYINGRWQRFTWKLDRDTSELQTGTLTLKAVNRWNVPLAVHELPDFTWSEREQLVKFWLPPQWINPLHDELNWELSFATAESQRVLGRFEGRSSGPRPLLIVAAFDGYNQRRNLGDEAWDRLGPDLMLEQGLFTVDSSPVNTVVWQEDIEQAPTEGLGWMNFDAVALADRAVQVMRANQWEALAQWVKAGGSVYVQLHRQHLSERERRGLQGLFDTPESGPPWLHVPELAEQPTTSRLYAHHCGLGRVVLQYSHAGAYLPGDEPNWPLYRQFFWKTGHDWQVRIAALQQQATAERVQARMGGAFQTSKKPGMRSSLEDFILKLMPTEIAILPKWLVLTLLASLVLLVGPVDYFFLRSIKQLRWTWVTLPFSLLVLTGITVAIAQASLGSSDVVRELVIRDYDARGRFCRSSTLQLRILTQPRAEVLTTERAMTCDYGRLQQWLPWCAGDDEQLAEVHVAVQSSIIEKPATLQGQQLGRMTLTAQRASFTPAVVRSLTLAAHNDLPLPQPLPVVLETVTPLLPPTILTTLAAAVGNEAVVSWRSRQRSHTWALSLREGQPIAIPLAADQVASLSNERQRLFAAQQALANFGQYAGIRREMSVTPINGHVRLDDLAITPVSDDDQVWLVASPTPTGVLVQRWWFPGEAAP